MALNSGFLSWKDVGEKLSGMSMPTEADRLRQKFQKANAKISPEMTIVLLTKSLSGDETLNSIDRRIHRRSHANSNSIIFAAFQGRLQNVSRKEYHFLDGEHSFNTCAYLNVLKRSPEWQVNPEVVQKFDSVVNNPRDKRGEVIQAVLKCLNTSWEDVKSQMPVRNEESKSVTFMHTAESVSLHVKSDDSPYTDTWIADTGT